MCLTFLKKVYVFIGLCNISNKVMIQTGCLLLAFFLFNQTGGRDVPIVDALVGSVNLG